MLTRRHFVLASGAAGIGLLASRGRGLAAADRIRVVATISIIADLVRNVGGDRVAIATLVGPDGDAHVYNPAPIDARKLAEAQVVVMNGLGLEGWMTRLVQASGTKAVTIVATKGVHTRTMEEDGRQVTDPHAWQSVADAKIYVANIRDGLIQADPAGRPLYERNAAAYLARLDALEAEVRAVMARIPAERRKIITTHDAFGYFGAAYGMTFISPEGVSTESEASAKDVAGIITQIRRDKIPAVFLENVADARLARQIARESGAKIGGTLFSDSLSPPGGPAATYIDMMQHNIQEFAKALTG